MAAQAVAGTANRIVAIVNDGVITEADVTSQAQAQLDQQERPAPDATASTEMHHAVLGHLIEQQLILQEAKRSGISIGSEEVMERLDEVRGRFGSEEEFRKSLQDSNLSEEQVKEKIREQLMAQRLVDKEVRSTVKVSPQEVAREVANHPESAKGGDRVRAAHILIRVDEHTSEEKARALVTEIHQQLRNGADFAALAKRYSEDAHRDDGGALGWIAQGDLLPELDAVLFSLKAGEMSSPMKTRLGFHIVKVEERRSASSLTIMEANRAVYQRLYQQKFQDAFTRWLATLKQHAFIEIVN